MGMLIDEIEVAKENAEIRAGEQCMKGACEEMQIEYTKRVIKQAKIEVLTELKTEIEEVEIFKNAIGWELTPKTPTNIKQDCIAIIQQKINGLKAESENKE